MSLLKLPLCRRLVSPIIPQCLRHQRGYAAVKPPAKRASSRKGKSTIEQEADTVAKEPTKRTSSRKGKSTTEQKVDAVAKEPAKRASTRKGESTTEQKADAVAKEPTKRASTRKGKSTTEQNADAVAKEPAKRTRTRAVKAKPEGTEGVEATEPAETVKSRRAKPTPEQIADAEKYPLAKELLSTYEPLTIGTGGHRQVYWRPQIVSPQLCDDVLSYLAPTLERHRGCDIIDLCPGAGLWSSKLHEFLQPRKHILVEPNPEKYEKFLRPLVEKPGSRYKLVTGGDMKRYEFYDQITKEHLYPDGPPVNTEDPQLRQPNDSLLVTGSLMFTPMLKGLGGFSSLVKQLMFHFVESMLSRDTFHTHGPARMLFWMPEDEINYAVPRTIASQNKASITFQRLSDMNKVVMPNVLPMSAGRGAVSRDPALQLESSIKVLRNAEKNGFVVPDQRRSTVHGLVEDYLRLTDECQKPMMPSVFMEFLKEQYLNGKSITGLCSQYLPEILSAEIHGQSQHSPGRLSRMRAASKYRGTGGDQRWLVANKGEEMYHVECQILRTVDEGKRKELEERLHNLEKSYQEGADRLTRLNEDRLAAEVDDRIVVRGHTAPNLRWDSRPFEPLTIHSAEIWPTVRAGLLDTLPKPIEEGNAIEEYEYFKDLLMPMLDHPRMSVPKALEGLSAGASELIKEVPSLRDPAQGGRLNIDNMRVRMLTPNMVDDISRAMREWLFRPPGLDHPNFFRAKWMLGSIW